MTEPGGSTLVHLAVSEPLPIEAAAGSDIVLTARVSCSSGCDRTGMAITVTAPDGAAATHALTSHHDGISATAPIVLKAPPRVGDHVFRLVLPPHEIAGTRYPETALDVPVRTGPQALSLAVWDIASPVIAGTRFTIKAGAKSTADCALAGRAIEIWDASGMVVARGMLSDTPWPGTAALYWTQLGLLAPEQEGVAVWSARFEAAELDLPHEGAWSAFSLAVVRPPEHLLSVKVIEQATAAPIPDVELRLGAYRGTTGPSGLAEIALPKGRYELHVWKVGYDAPPRPVEIGADAFVEVEALFVPEEDPDARWKM
jgi:hypothetical protein